MMIIRMDIPISQNHRMTEGFEHCPMAHVKKKSRFSRFQVSIELPFLDYQFEGPRGLPLILKEQHVKSVGF